MKQPSLASGLGVSAPARRLDLDSIHVIPRAWRRPVRSVVARWRGVTGSRPPSGSLPQRRHRPKRTRLGSARASSEPPDTLADERPCCCGSPRPPLELLLRSLRPYASPRAGQTGDRPTSLAGRFWLRSRRPPGSDRREHNRGTTRPYRTGPAPRLESARLEAPRRRPSGRTGRCRAH